MDDLPYLLAFSRFPKFGPRNLGKIRAHFDSFQSAWRCHRDELLASGIHPNLVGEFIALRPTISPEKELAELRAHDLDVVTLEDDRYPPLLKEIHDPPLALFVRGTLPSPNQPLLSLVGSRQVTSYGKAVIERLIPPLIHAGIGIVSGLAIGCDGHAHHHTVEAGGVTWGVLAGGCDWNSLSPTRHRSLASRMIATGGGVLSESPVGTPSLKQHFPIRNRIISGMTRATLIVEATERSGSLITARSAIDQNRDVLAVPGPITSPLSMGPNRLLRDGAHVVTSAEDILRVLEVEPQTSPEPRQPIEPQNANEATLLLHLNASPMHVDDLVLHSRLPASTVLQTLTALELRDGVTHVGGNRYRRTL